MAESFHLSIVLPTKKVFDGEVTEMVLPAHDGEVGVLPKHENFVGILGTGPLKYIHHGKDYWFVVSSGVFKVVNGKVAVMAEYVEPGENVDPDPIPPKIKALEAELAKQSEFTGEFEAVSMELQREKAKLEVHRRTHLLN